MIRTTLLASALFASACASPPSAPEQSAATSPGPGRFSGADIAKLAFLEGRWTGIGPDGQPFYDQYSFPDKYQLRSERFDSTFTALKDRSRVYVHDGQLISHWYSHTWRATELRDGYVAFEPINAPSSFHWKQIDANTIEVLQRFTSDDGKPQSYTMLLKRIGG